MTIRLTGVVVPLVFSLTTFAAAPPATVEPGMVKALLKKLDSDSFPTRQKADERLRAMGKIVLPHLKEEMARTRSLEVRWRLGRIIHDLTIDERVGALVQLLGDKDAQTRERADWALRQAGASVVPLLQKEIKPQMTAEQRRRMQKIIAELAPVQP